ncbi:MAG: TAXI family TRAP transporter solute-binding subunit [Vicinamibacterales bacterium]
MARPTSFPRRTAAGVLVIVAGVLAQACGSGDSTRLPHVNLITGATGSDWYRIGSAVALHTNTLLGGQLVTAVPGAGGISNPARVARFSGDFGVAFVPFLRLAYEGAPPYPNAFRELRHVASLISNTLHLIVSPELTVASLADIKTQQLAVRMGTGPPGSGEELLLRESLALAGITYDDIRAWGGRIDLLGSAERADLFRDDHIDLIVFNSNAPSAVVTELMLSRPARFLPMDDETREALRDRWHVELTTLPGNTYANQPAEIPTVGITFGLFTTAEMREDYVYSLAKAVATNQPYLQSIHVGFRTWNPKEMVNGGGIPLHPGAARYYRERGWVQP